MGFALRFEGAMPSGIYRCLQSVVHSKQALLLDAHPVLACSCLRLLASIGFGHPKTSCLGVSQSEQALLLYIQKQLARLSVTLCKHRGCNDVACFV